MSKESKNDRPSLVGTRTNYPRAQHHSENSFMRNARIVGFCLVVLLIGICAGPDGVYSQSDNSSTVPGAAGEPYPNMPSIAPIGVRIGKYLDVPSSSQGPPIDPAKGYRVQDLGSGLYIITDNAIQSMFLVYDRGVVVIDAPQNLAGYIPKAIAELTNNPITHLIYSHSHADHIGGAKALGGHPIIIAHEPGNIFIYAPAQRVLMVVDVVFPGWMPWRRFALAQDIPGYFAQVEEIRKMDWDTFVGGHVARTGTHADVDVQAEFNQDVKLAAATALATTKPGEGLNPLDKNNPWAFFDHYIDRVAAQCVNTLAPKWSTKLGGFDVYVWDQCYSMEQTLRIE